MKIKKYYTDEPNKIYTYIVECKRNPCGCGSNVYHYEYDGKNIYGKCNACKAIIYEVKDEYIKEVLSEGLWK